MSTTNTISESVSDSMVLQYVVRAPKITSAQRKAIILLHGVGSNENDLFSLASQLPDDFLVICPRGQFTIGPNRYAWFNVDFSGGKPVYDQEQEASSRSVIKKFIAQVKQKYHIDELFLGGFSQGGIMSYSIGLTDPTAFKGIVSLSGRLLIEIRPSIAKNDDLQHLNVFVAHGVEDNTLGIEYARDAISFLENAGVKLTYHEYNMGHQVNENELHDLVKWLNK